MTDKLIRGVVRTLLVICLASSAAANSQHPNVVTMQVVTLDVAAIERSAQSGTLIVYQSADVLFICFVNTVPTGPATPFTPLRVSTFQATH
jgi:hypothetical protein